MNDPSALTSLSREALIRRARALGVERPERMTRAELRDEVVRLSIPEHEQPAARGLFGVARSMLANVVEAGLNLPDAAAIIRGETSFDVRVKTQPPVATVTLAEIYAAQGHRRRALRMLDDVLAQEPDHEVAKEVRQRLQEELSGREPESAHAGVVPSVGTYGTAGFVDTTGEEIATGKPPEVAPVEEPLSVAEEPEAPPPHVAEEGEAALGVDVRDAITDAAGEGTPPVLAGSAPPVVPPSDYLTEFPLDTPARDALFHRTGEGGTDLYWEVSAVSVDRLRRRLPDGRLVIQVVAMQPAWSGAERFDQTVEVKDSTGVAQLAAVSSPAVVRAALGWLSPEGFTPLAVSCDLADTVGERGQRAPSGARANFDEDAAARARIRLLER